MKARCGAPLTAFTAPLVVLPRHERASPFHKHPLPRTDPLILTQHTHDGQRFLSPNYQHPRRITPLIPFQSPISWFCTYINHGVEAQQATKPSAICPPTAPRHCRFAVRRIYSKAACRDSGNDRNGARRLRTQVNAIHLPPPAYRHILRVC